MKLKDALIEQQSTDFLKDSLKYFNDNAWAHTWVKDMYKDSTDYDDYWMAKREFKEFLKYLSNNYVIQKK